jgi:hypothetical protein
MIPWQNDNILHILVFNILETHTIFWSLFSLCEATKPDKNKNFVCIIKPKLKQQGHNNMEGIVWLNWSNLTSNNHMYCRTASAGPWNQFSPPTPGLWVAAKTCHGSKGQMNIIGKTGLSSSGTPIYVKSEKTLSKLYFSLHTSQPPNEFRNLKRSIMPLT